MIFTRQDTASGQKATLDILFCNCFIVTILEDKRFCFKILKGRPTKMAQEIQIVIRSTFAENNHPRPEILDQNHKICIRTVKP